MKKFFDKSLVLGIILGICLTLFLLGLFVLVKLGPWKSPGVEPPINRGIILTFEDCVAEGYPVLESHPRQCRMPDGSVFTEGSDQVLDSCGIENCHGLEIVCGSNVPDFCTEVYMIGDRCRQFASCEIIDGACQPVFKSQFDQCKKCVEDCIANFSDSIERMNCEANCGR